MDAMELVERLSQHPLVLSQLPLQMQLGLPYLAKKRGELCVRFLPHRENFTENQLEIYPGQYILEFVYPFEKIVCFRNLLYEGRVDTSSPIGSMTPEFLAAKGKYCLNELYGECSRVLTAREKTGNVSDVMIANYQKLYGSISKRLGLEQLYGGADDLCSGV